MVYLHPDLHGREFGFKDIIMVPYKMPDFPRSAVDLRSNVTRRIQTYAPFLSAPMDTVTASEMAIALELLGGIGVIHYNFSTVDAQIRELERVKNYKAAFVEKPICLTPDHTVADVHRLNEERGFYSVPITLDGTPNTPIIGFVSRRDVRYVEDGTTKLRDVMTPRERLITANRRDTMDKSDIKSANALIRQHNLDTLIIVDDDGKPCALVTDRDLKLHERYPTASVDRNKQLYGFIAVQGAWHDPKKREREEKRIHMAAAAGVDCLVIDQGIVYDSQIEIARYIKSHYPQIEVGVGNVACGELVEELMGKAGDFIDMIKVGVGPGGACITQEELGVGRAQPSAVYECAEALRKFADDSGRPALIADGGVTCAGDIVKLFALGTNGVMMGQMFAPYKESPMPAERRGDKLQKKYRGMGSVEAMESGSEIRYGMNEERVKVPEGIVKWLDYVGPVEPFMEFLIEAVKQGIGGKLGFRNIRELQEGCKIYPYPGK